MQITQDDQGKTPCAVWLRVSTGHQESANQEPDIDRFVSHRDYAVTRVYRVADSAWKRGPEYRAALDQMLDDAHAGHFKVLVVWSLDRIVRSGSEPGMSSAEEALRLIRKLNQAGVALLSTKEAWLSTDSEVQSVLISFAGWLAGQESQRRSDRIKAGLARRKADDLPIGRQPGARDKTDKAGKSKRRTEGYRGNQNAARKAADE